VLPQERKRRSDTDLERDLQQPLRVDEARNACQHWQSDAACKAEDRLGVEAELRRDVVGVRRLLGECPCQGGVVDQRMPFRVAGDPDRCGPVRVPGDQWEELDRGGERAERGRGVAGDHEQIVQPLRHQRVEVVAAAQHPRGEMERDVVAESAQPTCDRDALVEAVAR
jgi:hypothetical protein